MVNLDRPIISENLFNKLQEVNPDGSYQYQYKTSNEIAAQESGVGGVIAQGSTQWYAPDGTGIQFSYTADQNGYVPTGTHLPTPHPIPEYIIRAAEWAKTHPWHDEWTKPEDLL